MSGSGGDTGYDYQADALAYVAAFGLTGQPLNWFSSEIDIPVSWSSETGGPGDDIRIVTTEGSTIEVQAKHAFRRGEKYNEAFKSLVDGLRQDQDLRAVMLVDHHSSEVILDDLRTDLLRLGQGRVDGLKAITTELLECVNIKAEEDSIFSRLRVVVVDLDDGNDGYSAAQTLLTKIVGPAKCRVAFTALGKRGHNVIKLRGADNAFQCARYLSTEIGVLPNSDAPTIERLRFIDWSKDANRTFFSPAFQKLYPIGRAWSSLIPFDENSPDSSGYSAPRLEDEIARYQEWTRLANVKRRDEEIDIQTLIARERLSVVVGGPGAGKTTLGRKIVWQTIPEKLAFRIRLPSMLALIATGKGFHDALAELGCDSFGGSAEARSRLLSSCELLILDALDECDPHRVDIAHHISTWAMAHPSVRICVLTRPVGHAPATLPGFAHAELLPLNDGDIREAVRTLFEPLILEQDTLNEKVESFIKLTRTDGSSSVASMAARNPLLLSFLARLYLDGEPLDGNRADLLGRIVELIRRSPPLEKLPSSRLTLPATHVWAGAEIIGWETVELPQQSAVRISESVAARLRALGADDSSEQIIDFWGRQGLIERITLGSRDAIVFVHLSLGEYFAGRHMAHQDSGWLRAKLSQIRRQPRWREPILLASGCGATKSIVSILLELDDPADLESTEALLAAAALSEGSDINSLAKESRSVSENLELRLTSDIPLIVIEAAISLTHLAPLISDSISTISIRLRDHKFAWTRFVGFALGLYGRAQDLPIREVITWLSKVRGSSDWPTTLSPDGWGVNVYELTKLVVPKALKRIAVELPATEAEEFVVSFVSRGDISVGILQDVYKELADAPYCDWVIRGSAFFEQQKELVDTMERMRAGFAATHAAEVVLMEVLVEFLPSETPLAATIEVGYPNLGQLISSMKLGGMPAGDLVSIRAADRQMVAEVFRGILAGLPTDLPALRIEAEKMKGEIEQAGANLLDAANDVRELDVTTIAKEKLDMSLLIEALLHHSQTISWNALRIINARSLNHDELELLTRTFMVAEREGLRRCAFLLSKRFGLPAFSLFNSRWLRGPGEVCASLLEFLHEAAQGEIEQQRAIEICIEALNSNSPALAEVAAASLEKFDIDSLRPHESALSGLLSEWKAKGSWCVHCKKTVHSYSCKQCHIVPPSPRKNILIVLGKLNHFSFEELLEFTHEDDNGVQAAATSVLLDAAKCDPKIYELVLNAINQGAVTLLREFIKRAGQEIIHKGDSLRPLLSSPVDEVRAVIVGTLDSAWLSDKDRRIALLAATTDPSAVVRSAAARVLRTKSSETQGSF